MKKLIFLLLFFAIVSCKSRKITADSDNKYEIEALARTASGENLSDIYPEANIEEGVSWFEEGTVERAYTKLFPGSKDELLITWEDKNRTQLYNIRVDKKGRWKSSTGIQIGTTYNELVALNNNPISFYGFGWDYGGAVDYEGGKLEETNIRVFLAPENEAPRKFYGDRRIDATEEEINDLNLTVTAILYQEFE